MPAKSLHTLNARGNVMLEVIQQYFKITPERMFREIQGLRQAAEDALALKGISYDALKTALVPDRQRREIALVFDSVSTASGSYGYDVFEHVIPLLDKNSNHSILAGDYLDHPGQLDELFSAFEEAVELRRSVEFRHPTQFFIVYINNLTDAMVEHLDKGLKDYGAYVGIADMTYMSRFKFYLSTMLANSFIKHGKIILQGHEPDRDDTEDVNMRGYPFEENGFVCRSIDGDVMGVVLSYKIERPAFPGFESDTHFALNAICTSPLALNDFDIEVEEAKLEYLKREKAGSMSRAGLASIDRAQLSALIHAKVQDSYIYNLSFSAEHDVIKFNVIVEIPQSKTSERTRLLAVLEYQPEEKLLRLITLY
ncbi:hypothetical protein [Aurantimonas coralicida]|uniref:hypothetical protein n=1 Tax=Aurantimonas coralicida TaxID=182270 RepID=UPI0023A59A6D|nr:hypothetical protein [Aurantimonas coralicida]MDE0925100.1 hypothetical protein [Aurantimonas coralicida]